MSLPYLMYPPETGTTTPAPLLIFLHGTGERGNDLELLKRYGTPRYCEDGARFPAYVVAPQCPDGDLWMEHIRGLHEMLDAVLGAYPIDERRIYGTGFSLGGFGLWAWAAQDPGRFAAISPVGGSVFLPEDALGVHDIDDILTLRETPIRVVHGARDPLVPVEVVDAMVEAMRAADFTRLEYVRYPDATHGGTSDLAFYNMAFYEWFWQFGT